MNNNTNNSNDNDILISKIFVGTTLCIAIILFTVAFFTSSKIHFTESIVISKRADSLINILRNPIHFFDWNPWAKYGKEILYYIDRNSIKDTIAEETILTLYWNSTAHPLTKGHLFIKKESENKLVIDADLAEQTYGTIEFTAYPLPDGKTKLQFDYYAEYPLDPMKRLYGFAMQFYFPKDMKQALELIKSNLQ